VNAIAKAGQLRPQAWRPPASAGYRPYAADEANGDEIEAQLPEALPAGERIVWHGRPDARLLALRALHVRKIAIYFGALMIWRGVDAWGSGAGLGESVVSALWMLPLALTALGLLALLAWAMARTTSYTLTERRAILRIGVALPMTVNIPLSIVDGAAMQRNRDGSGDIVLNLRKGDRIAYLHLWPHVRPWRFAHPCPMLRALPDVQAAAAVLARALEREHAQAPVPAAPAAAGTAGAGAREALA